jgi:predicted transcriptional regulator
MTKTTRILRAMRAGAKTSSEIAQAVRLSRSNISAALCGLADLGIIERVGVVNAGALGRPYVNWRPKASTLKGVSQHRG